MTVVLVDNRFEPDHLVFRAGQRYELRLESHGKELHEFTAAGFLKAAVVKDQRLLSNGGTDVAVQPGIRRHPADCSARGAVRAELHGP